MFRGVNRKKEHIESYEADFDNEDQHGDYLTALCLNEKIRKGRMQGSCVVIIRPNTHPSEIPFLKAEIVGTDIVLTSLAHREERRAKRNPLVSGQKSSNRQFTR